MLKKSSRISSPRTARVAKSAKTQVQSKVPQKELVVQEPFRAKLNVMKVADKRTLQKAMDSLVKSANRCKNGLKVFPVKGMKIVYTLEDKSISFDNVMFVSKRNVR